MSVDTLRAHLMPYVSAEDIDAVCRLIAKQRNATDEDKALILQALGLDDGPPALTKPRSHAGRRPNETGPNKCDRHNEPRKYLPGTGWRCRQCHNESQRRYAANRKEAK